MKSIFLVAIQFMDVTNIVDFGVLIFLFRMWYSSEVIKGDGKHISQAVKHWVERYEKYPKPAMVELLMMLFEVIFPKLRVMLLESEETSKLLKFQQSATIHNIKMSNLIGEIPI